MILYGAGGHGKVVRDCLISQGETLIGVFDDDPDKLKFGHITIAQYHSNKFPNEKLVLSIGNNKIRHQLSQKIEHSFGTAIHDSSFISESSVIDFGCMIFAMSIVQADVKIGKHSIINSGSIIEHDSIIGDYVHVGPGAVVCGNVVIENGAFIGANATVLPGIKIGAWSVVGAGSVVNNDVGKEESVVGNPAMRIANNYEK